jgi:hypothetical protein
MMERNTTPAKTTRKRKRAGDSLSENSDEDLKKRGRPRTEKPDASAADVSSATACLAVHEIHMIIDNIYSADEHKSAWLSARTDREKKVHLTN